MEEIILNFPTTTIDKIIKSLEKRIFMIIKIKEDINYHFEVLMKVAEFVLLQKLHTQSEEIKKLLAGAKY